MLHTPFPLPERWRTDLPWFFLAIYAPIVTNERVVMRCGEKMVSFRPEDGAIEWQIVVDPDNGNGALFLEHQGCFLTEMARLPDLLATILAVDAAGQELWRTDLDTMVALGSAVVIGESLLALSLGATPETCLYRIDLPTGALQTRTPLPWPADGLVPVPGGLVARNHHASGDTPGLYRMGMGGTALEPVRQEPVHYLQGAGARLLAVSQPSAAAGPEVHVHDAGSLANLWSAPAHTEAAALDEDGEEVFHVAAEDGAEHGVLVARDARTGAERWRSAPLPGKVLSISASGPVLLCNHRKGQALYRRHGGALVGEMRGSFGPPTAAGEHLYVCRTGAMLCTSLRELL